MVERKETTEADAPARAPRLAWAVGILCLVVVVGDLFQEKHVHFDFQGWIGFDAALGFVACVAIAIASRLLLPLLSRGEDFYD